MIYLLLGKDDFSKKEFLESLKQKQAPKLSQPENALEVCSFYDLENLAQAEQAILDSNLFGGKKLVKLYGLFSAGLGEEFLNKIKASANIVVFIEESLDKRKAETKKILENKNLEIMEFEVPAAAEFKKWVIARAKKYDLKLSGKALDLFLQRLGIDQVEFGEQLYSLWQADSELQ